MALLITHLQPMDRLSMLNSINRAVTSLLTHSFRGLSGSGELVPNPYYDTTKFIWGLQGTLTSVVRMLLILCFV